MATMRQPLSFDGVHDFLDTLSGDDLHAERVKSLAGATLGAIQSASLAVGLIGQGLALARGRLTKHAVKQVEPAVVEPGHHDRCPAGAWVPTWSANATEHHGGDGLDRVRRRRSGDDHAVSVARHGRATPLVWLTVDKAALKNRRNGHQYQDLVRLAEILPADVRVRIVADRGFGDDSSTGC